LVLVVVSCNSDRVEWRRRRRKRRRRRNDEGDNERKMNQSIKEINQITN
jgi:hypothetical protein